MQRDSRLFPKHELSALVLFSLAPLVFGCVKLRTLDCESTPEGCQDLKPDAKLADAPVTSPDAYVPADAAPADLAALPDTSDVALDSASLPDTAPVTVDGPLPDGTGDRPVDLRDATPSDIATGEGGVPDGGRLDTMDSLPPDTARPLDTRTPDTALMPDTSASTIVTFSAGVGRGAMTGYGWVTLGASDFVTSPTCGAAKAAITSASSCVSTATNWDSSDALCVSGTVPALPAEPTSADYTDNWGLQVGVNASDPIGAIGKSYSTITLNYTGTPQTGLRATIHRTGDPVGTTYCALVTSGTAMALTSFNTTCWNSGSGVALTAADLPKIDKVGLEVPSTQQEIAVTKLCLTSIVFGN
jgi:hypothetical protein